MKRLHVDSHLLYIGEISKPCIILAGLAVEARKAKVSFS